MMSGESLDTLFAFLFVILYATLGLLVVILDGGIRMNNDGWWAVFLGICYGALVTMIVALILTLRVTLGH